MNKTIVGLFARRTDAEDAADLLKAEGYKPRDISVVVSDKTMEEALADDTGAIITGGAITGLTAGTFIGGLAALLGSYIVPGLGAFFIGGPIAALFGLTGLSAAIVSGVMTGALAGGLVGAIIAFGLSVDETRAYEQRILEGAVLLSVSAKPTEEKKVERIFKESDAEDIKTVLPYKFEPILPPQNDYLPPFYAPEYSMSGVKGGRLIQVSKKEKPRSKGLKGGRMVPREPMIKGSSGWYSRDETGSASGNVVKRRVGKR